ncbi:cell division protein [Brochothrix thermosphacta]|uniref:putative polysaccharide biosynthesis protein n=1 Tax=Brochothrix thermosphacta TaxID=2756 RepID=UPI000E7175D1|nr:polysaccharide biosynthesis protein [Brochothrix thermosphacta]ANZ94207.1 cell division protein [Brochothrix thermosphacta]
MGSNLLRGTFILSVATLISKILGLIYIIPFTAIVKNNDAMSLYNYGYIPYQIFLSVATAGLPLAVAKYISKYEALGDYEIGQRLFKSGLVVMTLTGVASFVLMYVFAPQFAHMVNPVDAKGLTVWSDNDITRVIRAVSWALIIIPSMSLIRGYFQGKGSMGPSAVSQVIEQFVRIIFMLVATFLVLYTFNGSMVTAISYATFAAFVAAVASLAVLIVMYYKRKPYEEKAAIPVQQSRSKVSLISIYKEVLVYAIPFIAIGVAMPVYQMIDQYTVTRILQHMSYSAKEALYWFNFLNFNANKLVLIPVTLATAFSMALLPVVTTSYVQGKFKEMHKQLDDVFQVLMFVTIPACIGMMVLARPIYSVFFGDSADGATVLFWYSPVAILFSLYMVTTAILQGIDQQRYTVFSLVLGLFIKVVTQYPLIELWGIYGAIASTALGFIVGIWVTLVVIQRDADYHLAVVIRRTVLMLLISAAMFAGVWLVNYLMGFMFTPKNRGEALLMTSVGAVIGMLIYGYLSMKSRLIDRVLGERGTRIRMKFRVK